MTATLAASGSGFEPPTTNDFFPSAILFGGTPFEINRIMLVRMIAAVVLIAVFWIGASRAKLVPGRFQNALEMILDFVRNSIAIEVLGEKLGRKYFKLLATIFLIVFVMNITGEVPFLNIAGTSVVGLPIVLALWVFVMYLAAGIKKHGVGGFLKSSLFPPGVPPVLYILLTPIEALQVFVLRPATLAIRLLANMVAGHLMLAICFSATSFFFFTDPHIGMKFFGVGTLASSFAFYAFELFVAALQAYVFAILTAVYLNMSLEDEH